MCMLLKRSSSHIWQPTNKIRLSYLLLVIVLMIYLLLYLRRLVKLIILNHRKLSLFKKALLHIRLICKTILKWAMIMFILFSICANAIQKFLTFSDFVFIIPFVFNVIENRFWFVLNAFFLNKIFLCFFRLFLTFFFSSFKT